MLWLALHLPSLSLEAFSASLPCEVAHVGSPVKSGSVEAKGSAGSADAPGSSAPAAPLPVALVAEHRISDVNAAAAACGLRAGMKRATAMALAADLLLGEVDPGRDAAALRAVAHAALAFTPAVTLQEGHATVLMEVRASLRLFGGLAALYRLVLEALMPLGHRVSVAAAPTALGAALLARWGQAAVASAASHTRGGPKAGATPAFEPVLGPHATRLPELARLLDAAPVWLLGPARGHWEALQGMGLRTLADLRELPRAGLARRFGEELLLDLDRVLGRAPDPRRWLELPTQFEARLELHQRADSTEQVLVAASALLARLVVWAQARHGRIAAFTLAMQHEPRHRGDASGQCSPATELRIELAEAALDAAHLQLLLRERLAQLKLAAPTLELRLRCRELVRAAPPNGELFPTRGSEALGLARLLERLRARLGDAQVQRLVPVADHRPERSSRGVPATASAVSASSSSASVAAASSTTATTAASTTSSLPAARLKANVARARKAARGDAPPPGLPTAHSSVLSQHVAGLEDGEALPLHRPVWLLPEPLPLAERNALPLLGGQPLQLLSGPERIETGWWDGEPAARDYFIALAADSSLVWVWRSRLPSSAAHDEGGGDVQWMLQGRFG